jgi:hypothetical protein
MESCQQIKGLSYKDPKLAVHTVSDHQSGGTDSDHTALSPQCNNALSKFTPTANAYPVYFAQPAFDGSGVEGGTMTSRIDRTRHELFTWPRGDDKGCAIRGTARATNGADTTFGHTYGYHTSSFFPDMYSFSRLKLPSGRNL